MSEEQGHKDESPPANPEIHFQPIVSLPKIEVKSLTENEEDILEMRAKLYRYDTSGDENEWKDRGVGYVKILKHKVKSNTFRVLMRRDKTFKICANHIITVDMELKPNCGSDKAWVWSVAADFADEEAKSETLAIKFGNAENAKKFKDAFEECQKELENEQETTEEKESDKLAKELEGLQVKEGGDTTEKEEGLEDKKETKEMDSDKKTTEEVKEQKQDKDVPEK